ncbi:MAG: hypothetical protein SFV22_03215 [Saprospiraceae bacterium]|nr:hypothetical protein [Saprospiraceae bacterium]
MSWIESIKLYFCSEDGKEGIIFRNARRISEAALAKAEKANLPVVTVEGDNLIKLTRGGKHRRKIGKLTRRPRLLSGQKLEMP